jgi:hypothetical protein
VSVGSLQHSERLYINRIVYIFTLTESCSVCSNAAFALHCRDNYDQVLTSPNSIVEVCQSGSLPCACQQVAASLLWLFMLRRICNLHHGHGIWRYYLLRAQILFPLNDSDSQAQPSNKAAAANALPKAPAFLRIGASAELT